MTKVFDDALLERAARDAAEALRRGDPDTLAGRFAPQSSPKAEQTASAQIARKRVERA